MWRMTASPMFLGWGVGVGPAGGVWAAWIVCPVAVPPGSTPGGSGRTPVGRAAGRRNRPPTGTSASARRTTRPGHRRRTGYARGGRAARSLPAPGCTRSGPERPRYRARTAWPAPRSGKTAAARRRAHARIARAASAAPPPPRPSAPGCGPAPAGRLPAGPRWAASISARRAWMLVNAWSWSSGIVTVCCVVAAGDGDAVAGPL